VASTIDGQLAQMALDVGQRCGASAGAVLEISRSEPNTSLPCEPSATTLALLAAVTLGAVQGRYNGRHG
jgi:hypothetical protein